jgi:hypothetical protein
MPRFGVAARSGRDKRADWLVAGAASASVASLRGGVRSAERGGAQHQHRALFHRYLVKHTTHNTQHQHTQRDTRHATHNTQQGPPRGGANHLRWRWPVVRTAKAKASEASSRAAHGRWANGRMHPKARAAARARAAGLGLASSG